MYVLLNLCMFVVEKLRMIEMLGSFDRCNPMLRMNIWGMLILRMNMGNVNVKNEHGEC